MGDFLEGSLLGGVVRGLREFVARNVGSATGLPLQMLFRLSTTTASDTVSDAVVVDKQEQGQGDAGEGEGVAKIVGEWEKSVHEHLQREGVGSKEHLLVARKFIPWRKRMMVAARGRLL